MQIIHRYTSKVLYESTADTIKDAVVAAVASVADLGGANLSGADLSGAYLSGANLGGADLSGAYLSDADLGVADLSGADLSDAYLSGADLSGADLSGACLSDAYLGGAYLSDAYLSGADLSGADLGGANLGGANLSDANLEPIKQDLIAEVLRLPNELEALRSAIVDGKIDGLTYSGSCACLIGTLARARGDVSYSGEDVRCGDVVFRARSSSPRERWFLAIKPGDTPDANPAARLALEWVDEAIAIRDNIRATSSGTA